MTTSVKLRYKTVLDEVEFAGLNITSTNVRSNVKFLDSIRKFSQPTDIIGAWAWLELVNQGAYAFAMAKQMQVLKIPPEAVNKIFMDS